MEKITASPTRVQDLIIDFLRTQTNLSIRLSENLQDLSRDLLDRIRQSMAKKVPLNWSLNNTFAQSVFQLASAAATGIFQVQGAKVAFQMLQLDALAPLTAAQLQTKADLTHKKDLMTTAAGIVSYLSQAGGTYLGARGETLTFTSQELQRLYQENTSLQKSIRDTQESLTATVKQISSHS